ncbi:hypothetical protein GCM10017673_39130 [Streptosporangium violaceochromogenes]|nr:hypothetical protein GCM10017673_39130 [Streptosporangium violaceochromogenes]
MKRSDLNTPTVLAAIQEHGFAALAELAERFPRKVVLAAYAREERAGNLEYGVSAGSPWLTSKGEATLRAAAGCGVDPGPPKPLAGLPRLQPQADPEAVRRTGEAVVAHMRAFAEAMRPFAAARPDIERLRRADVERLRRTLAAVGQAFAVLPAEPRMRDSAEAWRRARLALEREHRRKSEYRRKRR